MKNEMKKSFLALGIICVVIGLTGLLDPNDLFFGLMFLLPGLVLLFLHFRAQLHRQTRKPVSIPLVIVLLFFLFMGLSDLGKDAFGVALGFGVAIPLLLDFLLRMRSRKYPAETEAVKPAPPISPPPSTANRTPARKARPVKICPRCGAPGQDDLCEYCGGPL